jgi:hypothetical protein
VDDDIEAFGMKFLGSTGTQSFACSGEEADSGVMVVMCRCVNSSVFPV